MDGGKADNVDAVASAQDGAVVASGDYTEGGNFTSAVGESSAVAQNSTSIAAGLGTDGNGSLLVGVDMETGAD